MSVRVFIGVFVCLCSAVVVINECVWVCARATLRDSACTCACTCACVCVRVPVCVTADLKMYVRREKLHQLASKPSKVLNENSTRSEQISISCCILHIPSPRPLIQLVSIPVCTQKKKPTILPPTCLRRASSWSMMPYVVVLQVTCGLCLFQLGTRCLIP